MQMRHCGKVGWLRRNNIGKSPAFQTYAADFYMDTAGWDPYAVGIYWRLLMYEWINGALPTELEELTRIGGAKIKTFNHFWNHQVSSKFSVNGNGKLINRRMEEVRQNQSKYSESRRKNVSVRYKDKPTYEPTYEEHNSYIDPALQSSSSSSTSKDKKNKDIARSDKPKRAIVLADNEFIQALKENPAYEGIDIDREIWKLDAWLLTPRGKGKQKTRQRIVNWLNRAEKPVQIEKSNQPIEPVKYVDRDGSIGEWNAKQK